MFPVFYLILVAQSMAQESLPFTNFLQATLDKIQKERLDSSGELSETDLKSEFDGEIILETGAAGAEASGNNYEQQYTNINSLDLDETATSGPTIQSTLGQHGGGTEDTDIKGYYYYFYPLNHYLEKEPTNDSDEMSEMMETMMNNNTMIQKQDTRVTPLFKAVTWFIGTAMVFVVSILMLPKFKVKKAKEIIKSADWEDCATCPIQSIVNQYMGERPIVQLKNK